MHDEWWMKLYCNVFHFINTFYDKPFCRLYPFPSDICNTVHRCSASIHVDQTRLFLMFMGDWNRAKISKPHLNIIQSFVSHQFYRWINFTFILPGKSVEVWKLFCKEDLAKTAAKRVSDKTIQMQPTDETKLKKQKILSK